MRIVERLNASWIGDACLEMKVNVQQTRERNLRVEQEKSQKYFCPDIT